MQTPAEVVIEELGVRPLARSLDITPSCILKWRERKDGLVPALYHRKIIQLSLGRITPDDLVNGR